MTTTTPAPLVPRSFLDYLRSFGPGIVIVLTLGAIAVSRSGDILASWIERRFSHLASNLGHRIALDDMRRRHAQPLGH